MDVTVPNKFVNGSWNIETGKENTNEDKTVIKVYRRRIWMLFMFSFLSFLCGMIYPQYVSMANVTACYYNVTQNAVNWTSMMIMAVYAVLAFPASLLFDYIDLRWTVILGSAFNTAACITQFASLTTDGFMYVLLSTFCASLSNLFVLAVPPCIAARWFPSNELSRACAFGVFGNQLGIGVGFIFSPLLVSSDCSKTAEIEIGKRNVATYLTAANLSLLILIIATFQNAPKCPPSICELKKKKDKSQTVSSQVKTIFKMLKNIHFLLVIVVYGLMAGSYFAFATTLNDLILRYFPNKNVEIGWMGLLFIVTGLFGSILAGFVLDYTHKYKETYMGICISTLITYILFSVLLFVNEIWVQFLSIGILGVFFTSILPVGFEYGIEVTYPDSEIISACLLNTSTMVWGIILTEIVSNVLSIKGSIWSNTTICITLLLSSVIAGFITTDYKRTKGSEEKKQPAI